MSFTTNTTVNSGPLVIRTLLDGSLDNTYLLGPYDLPIAANYVLMTSNNGLVVPSRDLNLNTVSVSSIITSSIVANQCQTMALSTFTVSTTSVSTVSLSSHQVSTTMVSCSSLKTSTLTTSSLYSNGFTLENGSLRYTPLTKEVSTGFIYSLDSTDWWGKYIYVTQSSNDVSLSLPLGGGVPNGTFMYITNAASGYTTTVSNLASGDRSLGYTATAHVLYLSSVNRWFLIS